MKKTCVITASHYVLPANELTNEDLFERFGEKKVQSISKLSGISARRVAPENVTSVDLASAAAERMLESENISRDDFDMLIFITQTPDYILPGAAFVTHERLKFPESCGAFDINLGCSAMPYGLAVANSMIVSGQCKKILLVYSDTVTKLVNPKDRSLVTLHGDGAAVFVLEASDDADTGIEFCDVKAQAAGWKHLIVPAGGARLPHSEETAKDKEDDFGIICSQNNLQMNGAAVFHFSISTIPNEIKKSLEKHSKNIGDYDMVILHQANKSMVEQIYRAIGATEEQKFYFMEKVGNLSVASSPVVLAQALRQGKLDAGGYVLGAAFGVGLSWGVFSIKFKPNSVKASQASTDY